VLTLLERLSNRCLGLDAMPRCFGVSVSSSQMLHRNESGPGSVPRGRTGEETTL
jgi:hypothetical protein